MKIPDTIKVGNITYTIIIKKLSKGLFGLHKPAKQEIIISDNLSKKMQRNVFFHELTHALFFQIGAIEEKREELLVQSLANELDKLFKLKKMGKKKGKANM